MYEKFWGLNCLPFENTPDPSVFLESEQHKEALARLLYTVQERQAGGMLTSVYGCGKTLVLRRLRMELAPKGYRFSVVNNPRLSDLDILRMILHGFGGASVPTQKADVLMALETLFTETARDGKHSVVMIDEAHDINDLALLEELRLLLNYQGERHGLVSLLLAGQPELADKITNNKQLNQRLRMKTHLEPLSADETAQYIAFRLAHAGAATNCFSRENMAAVGKCSTGIPRWINNICHMTLMNAFLRNTHAIDDNLIFETYKAFGDQLT